MKMNLTNCQFRRSGSRISGCKRCCSNKIKYPCYWLILEIGEIRRKVSEVRCRVQR